MSHSLVLWSTLRGRRVRSHFGRCGFDHPHRLCGKTVFRKRVVPWHTSLPLGVEGWRGTLSLPFSTWYTGYKSKNPSMNFVTLNRVDRVSWILWTVWNQWTPGDSYFWYLTWSFDRPRCQSGGSSHNSFVHVFYCRETDESPLPFFPSLVYK